MRQFYNRLLSAQGVNSNDFAGQKINSRAVSTHLLKSGIILKFKAIKRKRKAGNIRL